METLRAGTAWRDRESAKPPQHDFPLHIATETAHRPWAVPAGPWLMTQSWHDLLFAHWRVGIEVLRPKIPPELEIDRFDGEAWIGLVPFYMANVAPRYVPALPWLSRFPELNVRTYVRAGGKPGVFFFSLDATNPLAVQAARLMFRLPYHAASMTVERSPAGVHYRSERRGQSSRRAEFAATYRPVGSVFNAAPGSIESFLTERYCFYARNHRNRPYRLEIQHVPWPLQLAEAEVERNSMAAASGITLPHAAPLLHFAKRLDIVAWAPAPLD